jgi:hypothetical protein
MKDVKGIKGGMKYSGVKGRKGKGVGKKDSNQYLSLV